MPTGCGYSYQHDPHNHAPRTGCAVIREILFVIALGWAFGKGGAAVAFPSRCGGAGGRCAVATADP